MGFFNWIMSGLGFESNGKKDKKVKQVETLDNKYANFNLHEKPAGETNVPNTTATNFNAFGMQTESNIVMFEPTNFKDIQQIVDCLKQGQTIAVNLQGIAEADSDRILDFLSGAIYGLNGSIHRWQGDLFLLTPEGHKILKKE